MTNATVFSSFLFTGDDEELTEEQSGDQQQNSGLDADMKDVSNSPTRSETPILASSPTLSQVSAGSITSPRLQTVSPSVSEPSSVDNKYLDVELELAKTAQSNIVIGNNTTVDVNPQPKVRLNTTLAADPATNPDAKDITAICEEKREIAVKEEEDKLIQRSEGIVPTALSIVPITLETPTTVVVTPRIAVFTCVPCGIKFSSASTLEAHQTYYCSHR